jgi:two-component system chemotaxis response regulator CheB
MSKKIINILIADDSKTMRDLLSALFKDQLDMIVVGCAKDGVEAVQLTKKLKPDIVTMDINMPTMDGLEATKKIMQECPTPIVMISALVNGEELNATFNALKAGALSVLEKPKDMLNAGFALEKNRLLSAIRTYSDVRVVRRYGLKTKILYTALPNIPAQAKKIALVAIGASTGGPEVLSYILSQLSSDFPVPIVIVQHITNGFLSGLVNWLQLKSECKIEIVRKDREPLLPGVIYFAPDDLHLTIERGPNHPIAVFEDSPEISYFKPSITRLFSSIAQSYPQAATAGLLTGMGKDGAEGLLLMKKAGCHTFIQSEASSIIFGMPGAAKALHAECDTVDLTQIPHFLHQLINKGIVYDKENPDRR